MPLRRARDLIVLPTRRAHVQLFLPLHRACARRQLPTPTRLQRTRASDVQARSYWRWHKALGVQTCQHGTVRDANGSALQLAYGNDGLDAAYIERVHLRQLMWADATVRAGLVWPSSRRAVESCRRAGMGTLGVLASRRAVRSCWRVAVCCRTADNLSGIPVAQA
jgi:hypothetical protein